MIGFTVKTPAPYTFGGHTLDIPEHNPVIGIADGPAHAVPNDAEPPEPVRPAPADAASGQTVVVNMGSASRPWKDFDLSKVSVQKLKDAQPSMISLQRDEPTQSLSEKLSLMTRALLHLRIFLGKDDAHFKSNEQGTFREGAFVTVSPY